MRKISLALIAALSLLSAPAIANAAPVGVMDMKAAVTRDAGQVQQVHWRRWRHCHRMCSWRHHHRHCWRVCHGGHGGHGHHY